MRHKISSKRTQIGQKTTLPGGPEEKEPHQQGLKKKNTTRKTRRKRTPLGWPEEKEHHQEGQKEKNPTSKVREKRTLSAESEGKEPYQRRSEGKELLRGARQVQKELDLVRKEPS